MKRQSFKSLSNNQSLTALAAFLFIGLVAALAIYQQRSPEALPENALLTEFSAGRAKKYIEVISRKPHPIGAPEHLEVRNYLLGELTALGLQPEVQIATVAKPMWGASLIGGTVHNVVARLAGTGNSKAILFAAHYDSAPTSPGSNDDGTGIATILETIRALKAGAPIKNDVIVLFTDGEETGLLGAHAFVDEHPWAKEVGLILNFEARGNSGPALMFETSERNGWLIGEVANSAVRPVTNSLMYEVYANLLHSDTDFSVLKKIGPGLNFANIDGTTSYHSPLDNYASVDERSLQDKGDHCLGLARHFGNLDLAKTISPDRVYFNGVGRSLVHYQQTWGKLLGLAVGLLLITILVVGLKKRQLRFSSIALSFLSFPASILGSFLIIGLAQWLSGRFGGPWKQYLVSYNRDFYNLSFIALTISVTWALYAVFRRKVPAPNLLVGTLLWWFLLMAGAITYLPGASFLFTWPILFSLVGLSALCLTPADERPAWVKAAVLLFSMLPLIILLAPTISQILVGVGLRLSWLVMIIVVLLLGALIPQLEFLSKPRWWVMPSLTMIAGVGFLLTAEVKSQSSKSRPQPNSLFYVLDATRGRAVWASADEIPDAWTAQFLSGSPKRSALEDYLPIGFGSYLVNQAPLAPVTPPNIDILGDSQKDDIRTLRMRIHSPRQTPLISVYLDPGVDVLETAINGKWNPVSPRINADERWGVEYWNPPKEGIDLILKVKNTKAIKLTVVDQSRGLPELSDKLSASRPESLIPAGFPMNDSTLVSRVFSY